MAVEVEEVIRAFKSIAAGARGLCANRRLGCMWCGTAQVCGRRLRRPHAQASCAPALCGEGKTLPSVSGFYL